MHKCSEVCSRSERGLELGKSRGVTHIKAGEVSIGEITWALVDHEKEFGLYSKHNDKPLISLK